MKKRLVRFLQYGWLILIFGAAVTYLVGNFQDIVDRLRAVPFPVLLQTFALLAAGRLLLVSLSTHAVQTVNWFPTYRKMFRIHALSQLAKYLPGGVWHFVGQAGFYRASGMNLPDITRALFIENLWLVLSAGFVGSTLLILFAQPAQGWVIGLLLAAWYVILLISTRWRVPEVHPRSLLAAFLVQAGIWTAFGLSFFSILDLPPVWDTVTLGVGAFVISWLVGFLTPIAPGGIGVREVVLGGLILNLLPVEQSLVLVALHRMLWVLMELAFGLAAWLFTRD